MEDILWEKHLKGLFILVSQWTSIVAFDCKLQKSIFGYQDII